MDPVPIRLGFLRNIAIFLGFVFLLVSAMCIAIGFIEGAQISAVITILFALIAYQL